MARPQKHLPCLLCKVRCTHISRVLTAADNSHLFAPTWLPLPYLQHLLQLYMLSVPKFSSSRGYYFLLQYVDHYGSCR